MSMSSVLENSEFTITQPEHRDFDGIAKCFLEVYGHHYFHPEVTSATLYWEKVKKGSLIPLITRNADLEVIGHIALELDDKACVAERGEAVVLPEYRGHHLLEQMTSLLSVEAQKRNLIGVFAKPVTIHTFSQRNDSRAGMVSCGLMLGVSPEDLLPKNMPAPTMGQRQSVVLTFSFIQPPNTRSVFVPEQYREILFAIYEKLSIKLQFLEPARCNAENSSIEISIDNRQNKRLLFRRIGSDLDQILHEAVGGSGTEDICAIQLYAPLNDPGLQLLVDIAKTLGFFFCGVGPSFISGQDALILQAVRQPIDIQKLQLYDDFTIKLAGYVASDRTI